MHLTLIVVHKYLRAKQKTITRNSKNRGKQEMSRPMKCGRKWNISIQYDMVMNPLSQEETLFSAFSNNNNNNKLKSLPHVLSRILQLPLRSDADVAVEESPNCFRFMAETESSLSHMETHALHIHPGVTRIVVRASQSLHFSLDDLHPDIWRFRLPESVVPELTTSGVVDGVLVSLFLRLNVMMRIILQLLMVVVLGLCLLSN